MPEYRLINCLLEEVEVGYLEEKIHRPLAQYDN